MIGAASVCWSRDSAANHCSAGLAFLETSVTGTDSSVQYSSTIQYTYSTVVQYSRTVQYSTVQLIKRLGNDRCHPSQSPQLNLSVKVK